jgi:hypothetical protein
LHKSEQESLSAICAVHKEVTPVLSLLKMILLVIVDQIVWLTMLVIGAIKRIPRPTLASVCNNTEFQGRDVYLIGLGKHLQC